MKKLYRTVKTALECGASETSYAPALTTLGIVIGVGAVIAMTEIGQGSTAAVQKTIANMGANNLLVMPGTASSGGVTFGSGSVITLTPQDAEAINTQSARRSTASPSSSGPRNADDLRQQELGADVHLRHDAGVSRRPRVERPRGRARSPTSTSAKPDASPASSSQTLKRELFDNQIADRPRRSERCRT